MKQQAISTDEVLTRGSDVLKLYPNFKLVGRDQELSDLSTILMKQKKRNIIVTGPGGVGMSSIVLGIQESKKDISTPVDIVSKRFYWLDSDKLFESGNQQTINALFEKIRQTLTRTTNSMLIIEDTIDFIRGSQANGCTNLLNGLMGDIKAGKYQAILETKDDNIGEILKSDGDILECWSLYEVKEPSPANLRLIIKEAVIGLEKHHGVKVSDKALEAAAMVTSKYQLPELRAQPDASIGLLDRALADYVRQAHLCPPEREQVWWTRQQVLIRNLYKDISDGEEEIRKLEESIVSIRETQHEKAINLESGSTAAVVGDFGRIMSQGNLDTPEISAIKDRIDKLLALIEESKNKYQQSTADLYAGLTIGEGEVLKSFSQLSGIPVDKLNEDERIKLKNLEEILTRRVVGQTEPTSEVSKAVRRARVGLKMPNKPSGTFMFLGPSGVGKTELAKTLSDALQVPLLRYDMSEYMEKHALAKLIGAPPGYEGYEHGGMLTNQIRRQPYSVILFDEIEKAHPDVFNLMLQVLDDARLTDSRGLTASFKDAIIIMTTNIGTPHFLNDSLPFEEAKALALTDLREQYRPEFLGRFSGNIYCFKRLELDVLTQIAAKDILRINNLIKDKGISLWMSDTNLRQMIQDKYLPREGARSILGYIDRNITSSIADFVLGDTPISGTIKVDYDVVAKTTKLTGEEQAQQRDDQLQKAV